MNTKVARPVAYADESEQVHSVHVRIKDMRQVDTDLFAIDNLPPAVEIDAGLVKQFMLDHYPIDVMDLEIAIDKMIGVIHKRNLARVIADRMED